MSIWSSDNNSVVEEKSKLVQDFPRKAYTKIDPIGKLQVIHALDNGQCKTDIAREYGVHPQTIAYIYKQKDSIVKKYTQKYKLLKEAHCINLDQTLLDWFKHETKNKNVVKENQLHSKAQDVINTLSEKFTCIDDWLLDFRIRHNIVKYTSDIECSAQAKDEWMRFLNDLDVKNVYLCGVCALAHSLDLDNYVNGHDKDDYLSLMFLVNTLGTDKRELAVVGTEISDLEGDIRSLPVNYYHCDSPQINYTVILSYLKQWDDILISARQYVVLVINIPDDLISKLNFINIKIFSAIDYVTRVLDKLIECFKYHYRRLQISRAIAYGKDYCTPTLLDYIHMIGMGWHNVPCRYIQHLFFPPEDGSLYFNMNEDNDGDHSLSQWCKMYSIPLSIELCSNLLDRYILCDKNLPCLNFDCLADVIHTRNITDLLLQNNVQSTSGMEAYQAMKRLVSYLQGENAEGRVMKHAKYLENHLEYGALMQMHQIIASTND